MLASFKIVEEDIATCLKCNNFHGNIDIVSDHQKTCNDFTPSYMKAIDDLSQRIFQGNLYHSFENMSPNSKFESQVSLLSECRKRTISKDFLKTIFQVFKILGSASLETLMKEMRREPRELEIIPESMTTKVHVNAEDGGQIVKTKKSKKKKQKHKKGKKREATDEIVEKSLEKESVASQSKVIDEKVVVSDFSKIGKQKIQMVEMGKSPHLPMKRYIDMCLDGGEPSGESKVRVEKVIVCDGKQKIQQMVEMGRSPHLHLKGDIDMCLDGGEPSRVTEDVNECGFEELKLAKFDKVEESVHYLTEDGTRRAFEDLKPVKFDEVSVRLSDAIAVVGSWRDTGDRFNFDSYKRTGQEVEPQFDPAILLVSQVPPSDGEEGEIILWKGTK